MIKIRTIDGKVCESKYKALDYDLEYVRSKNTVMQDGFYRLIKINTIDELVPLIYGRYKIHKLESFPYYIIEDKRTLELTLVTVSDLNEALRALVTKRK